MPQPPSRTLTLLVLATIAAAPACRGLRRTDQYNVWKERCWELDLKYMKKLHENIPYHMYADTGADRCSLPGDAFRWEVDKKNLHIIVANLFYHYDIEVQARALELLKNYRCEDEGTCEDLAQHLDQHVRASYKGQSKAWLARLHQPIRDYHRYLLEKIAAPR